MDIPITLQIRTVEGGIPTSRVLPMSEVILDPDEVSISTPSGTIDLEIEKVQHL